MVDYGCAVIAPRRKRQFKHFHLYLKEVEWRFNHRSGNLVALLRIMVYQRVVKEQHLLQL